MQWLASSWSERWAALQAWSPPLWVHYGLLGWTGMSLFGHRPWAFWLGFLALLFAQWRRQPGSGVKP